MATLGLIKVLHAEHGSKRHAHDFRIEVRLQGTLKNDMVEGIDFHDVADALAKVISPLQDQYLNDIIGHATVENIAIFIIKKLSVFPIQNVTVWEAEDRFVTIEVGEMND